MSQLSQPSDESPEPAVLDEQLVAYLDGELSPEESRRVESLLASDPAVRRRLQGLDCSWQALDELERVPLDNQFTRTTMEMVALAATEDLERNRREKPRQRRRRWLLAGLSLGLAAACGFVVVWFAWPDPDRQLLQDLPLLQRLDEYRQVDDIEFLKMLAREGLFDEDRTQH